MLLKKRDLSDCQALYSLLTHPDVFPFIRHKPNSYEEFLFMTKQTIEAEERGEMISRTIVDERDRPIGTINLYDIENGAGFLGTWLGKPYHGKGYNILAKELFFEELFFVQNMETVLLRIRLENIRSQKAAEKIPYVTLANQSRPSFYKAINENPSGYRYNLYEITKDAYSLYYKKNNAQVQGPIHPLEA
ncbi:Ribosomal-protein-alanine acetyltransferase [Caldibacillus thermoamylovorans]|uniref:GNAT family N-acetyltransferase n=1 Tax=Caldibacillus thermoamylovorans TaxID=35841 RepID=UPI0005A45A76|nr:GNAT family N-acetyltransferase [Caldibacillus thermoamylovorans]KIO63222.1 Ribosomal-protein-alanine acetyltransferase [Caldibacillus thermoamylovorans]KIO65880.1 Ribosomal-protein-alanine acetyltransferase [Caldibacillus thermoamylovorans]